MKKHVKRKLYFNTSLREEEKKKKKKSQTPHNLAYVVSASIALAKKHYIYCIVYLNQMCEKLLELQQVSLIPFPHLENYLFFVNHNGTVAVCLSFMFIADIVCMCRMNL